MAPLQYTSPFNYQPASSINLITWREPCFVCFNFSVCQAEEEEEEEEEGEEEEEEEEEQEEEFVTTYGGGGGRGVYLQPKLLPKRPIALETHRVCEWA